MAIDAQKAEEYRKQRQAFTLLDDAFMTIFFHENIKATELVLRIILEKDDIEIMEVTAQNDVPSLQGRGIRLDVFAKDSKGKLYDIEVQCSERGAGFKRARYNSSLMDANILEKGTEHEELPETYVIFITREDTIGNNLPIYHIERTVIETGKQTNDGAHIIYVPASHVSDTPLGKLMEDFRNPDPNTMNYQELAEKAKMLKETEGGRVKMCAITEQWFNDGKAEGIAEGRAEGIAEGEAKGRAEERGNVAVEMIKEKTPISMIQKFTKLSLEQLQKLSKECGVALVM